MIDIVSDFKSEATTKGYLWLYGPKSILNYEFSNTDLSTAKYVFALLPVITQGKDIANELQVVSWSVSVNILFGRKFDVTASTATSEEYSSLDETYSQKYDRRLFTLMSELNTFIETVICGSPYRLISQRFNDQINSTDENIDFVSCELNIEYDETDS